MQGLKKPSWLKIKFPSDPNFFYVSNLVKNNHINTICQSAKCPNKSECWSSKTATFLILGNICTRNCTFCAVAKGDPDPPKNESTKILEVINQMELSYVVITSVTRDDLADGGASIFADIITQIKNKKANLNVEVLIPDFQGSSSSLKKVINAKPNVLNHNIEVPERLYPLIGRTQENYWRSINILKQAKTLGAYTKSGLMVGLGETKDEIIRTFSELRNSSCDLLTIGQYLQPSKIHASVKKFYSPKEFLQLKNIALDFGFRDVESGPLVRSSYGAFKMYKNLIKDH